jgi:hypothetical protein
VITLTQTLNQTLAAFEETRGVLETNEPEKPDLVLAVGILLGGGFPRCAASVAHLTETHFNDDAVWPWGAQ